LGLPRLEDTLADARFSARQKAYSHMRGDRDVYTPQVIVNGSIHVIGSDRGGIEDAIDDTTKTGSAMSVPVTMSIIGKQINVSVAASRIPTAAHGEVWICSVAKAVPISIGRGENSGREITYHNVVRNLLKVGDWNGNSGNWTVPLENISRDGVDAAVVYVQDGSRDRAGVDARRGLYVAALIFPLKSPNQSSPRIVPADLPRAWKELSFPQSLKMKKDQLSLAQTENNLCDRPDPDDPGGLGAEESGTERTGPTHHFLSQPRRAGGLAEVGRYYDSANDP